MARQFSYNLFFIFTLYPAYSRVGRTAGTIRTQCQDTSLLSLCFLRHSFPSFLRHCVLGGTHSLNMYYETSLLPNSTTSNNFSMPFFLICTNFYVINLIIVIRNSFYFFVSTYIFINFLIFFIKLLLFIKSYIFKYNCI